MKQKEIIDTTIENFTQLTGWQINIEIAKNERNESTVIPKDFNYEEITSLSREVREKLIKSRPDTIGMASRISGAGNPLHRDLRESQDHAAVPDPRRCVRRARLPCRSKCLEPGGIQPRCREASLRSR